MDERLCVRCSVPLARQSVLDSLMPVYPQNRLTTSSTVPYDGMQSFYLRYGLLLTIFLFSVLPSSEGVPMMAYQVGNKTKLNPGNKFILVCVYLV